MDPLLAIPAADRIPLASLPITIDGELREPAWNQRALRGVLADASGAQARPYSEIRLLHDAATLYVGLYAADEDIRSTESWELSLGPRMLHVDATGHADAPDVHAAVDRDGTLDQPDDYDEEWVLEVAVPLDGLGASPLAIGAKRCDTPKDGRVRCGEWHRQVGLE
jgi:hypothetical protein